MNEARIMNEFNGGRKDVRSQRKNVDEYNFFMTRFGKKEQFFFFQIFWEFSCLNLYEANGGKEMDI